MKIIVADSFSQRLFGLMFKKNITYGLLFKRCKSIHTFFFKFNIDILVLNKNKEIIAIRPNITKNKIVIIHEKDAYSILELPPLQTHKYHLKDIIDI